MKKTVVGVGGILLLVIGSFTMRYAFHSQRQTRFQERATRPAESRVTLSNGARRFPISRLTSTRLFMVGASFPSFQDINPVHWLEVPRQLEERTHTLGEAPEIGVP